MDSRTSRNNKSRGRGFENVVADLLGWTRVPYSGGSKQWGGADVVDGFYKKKGLWAIECKTQVVKGDKPANIDIKHKWVSQMLGGAVGGRHGVIAVRRVRQGGKPGQKGPRPYVVMHEDTFDWFRGRVHEIQRTSLDFAYDSPIYLGACHLIKTRGKGYNFGIPETHLASITPSFPLHVPVWHDGAQANWMVFTLDDFARLVKTYGIWERDENPN